MLTQDRPTPTNSESLFGADQLLLKRSITVKAVVTPLWKDEAQQQLQSQVDQIDRQLEQLDQQVQQMIAELQRQSRQILSVSGTSAETQAEIENIQRQGGDRKSELLEQREQILQQINQVLLLELGQEAEQGQIDSFFYIQKGDHLVRKLQVEILLRDGVIEEIRGDL